MSAHHRTEHNNALEGRAQVERDPIRVQVSNTRSVCVCGVSPASGMSGVVPPKHTLITALGEGTDSRLSNSFSAFLLNTRLHRKNTFSGSQ